MGNEEEEEENEDRMEKIEENKSSTHQRFESYQSNHSDPTPVPIKQKKNHSRGPSFAIKAYYGIEDDDDATGWDSRRSSMFGDYGKIHSRQQSKRVESQMIDSNIKDMFKVDIGDKLAEHLSVGPDIDNVADLFSDSVKGAKIKKTNNEKDAINIDAANDVSDLFEDVIDSELTQNGHTKKETYSGVKNLFGNDENSENEEDELDDIKDLEKMKGKKLPRPSTNVALGSTFDSILLIKDSNRNILEDIQSEEDKEESDAEQMQEVDVNADDQRNQIDEKRIEEVREEERAKLSVIKQKLQDEFDEKMKKIKNEIENELKEQITKNLSTKIRSECREEMEVEYDEKLKLRMANELDTKLNDQMSAFKLSFDEKFDSLKSQMDEREVTFQREMSLMEKSKCDLIQHTAKEIDSLRLIIRGYAHSTTMKSQNNENGMLAALIKWG